MSERVKKIVMLVPSAAWLALFFVMPLVIIFIYSLASRGPFGGVEFIFNPDNYVRVIDPMYAGILWRSVYISVISTAICLLIGYPLALYISRQSNAYRNFLLALLIIPFWTNFLVRTYAWMFILRTEGLLNNTLLYIGVISEPLQILFTDTAVIIGLVYTYLPFMVLPVYVSLEKLDHNLLMAARDLGATPLQSFRKVILPLTRPGVISGSILVFVPCIGAYITPDILGGSRSMMIGNLIQNQFLSARDWPFGSALSFVLMAIVLLLLLILARQDRKEEEA
ncbi:MAG: ABC transporter permease [Balneolaceae bacterium]|nr:MAG: ABC transporter permease [Balneolaceae bacterium]